MESENIWSVPRKSKNCILPKVFFLKFILWSRRMLFWQLCWEISGESLKLSHPNSKNDLYYLFYAKFVPSKISSRLFSAEILRFFPWKHERVKSFSVEHFFCKLLVWTVRRQLWWHLLHFSPESWKSSAQIHKLMEETDFNSIFFLRKALLDAWSADLVTLPNVLTRSPKIISSKSETDGKKYFWWDTFFFL